MIIIKQSQWHLSYNKFIQQGTSFNKFESFVLYTNNASELIDIMYEKGYKL